MVVGTRRVHLTQIGENSIQETTCHRGWTQPPVAGRSRRLVKTEKRQRRIRVSVAWCVPLKNKPASSLVTALKGLLVNIAPTTLQTDKGLEFLNRSVRRLLKEHGVHHFSTHNEETKASIVERFNRTLKTRMWRYFTKYQTVRYIDALQDFVQSYNDTYHRSIGMAPSQVNAANQEEVWQRLYGHDGKGVPKFKVDDRVRISEAAVRERVHGKLERGALHDTRSSRLRSTRVPVGRRSG